MQKIYRSRAAIEVVCDSAMLPIAIWVWVHNKWNVHIDRASTRIPLALLPARRLFWIKFIFTYNAVFRLSVHTGDTVGVVQCVHVMCEQKPGKSVMKRVKRRRRWSYTYRSQQWRAVANGNSRSYTSTYDNGVNCNLVMNYLFSLCHEFYIQMGRQNQCSTYTLHKYCHCRLFCQCRTLLVALCVCVVIHSVVVCFRSRKVFLFRPTSPRSQYQRSWRCALQTPNER